MSSRTGVERRDLSLLITGNMSSSLGNAVYVIAVTLLLKDLTESPLTLGLFQFLALSPGFLLSPLIGAIVDRYSRRRLLIRSDLYRAVLMILLGIALTVPGLRSPWLVLVVSFLVGVGHALFVPAGHALLPSLVSRDRLQGATGLRAAGSQLANLAGNAAGGALYVVLGAPLLFALDGLNFLLAALQKRFIRGGDTVSRPGASESVFQSARAGLSAVSGDRRLMLLVASQAGLFVISPVLMLSLPFLVMDDLGMSKQALGLFFALALAGAMGVFAFLRLYRADRMLRKPLVPLAYVTLGLGFLALAAAPRPVVLGAVALVSGAAAAVVYLFAVTWIQFRADPILHGRLFALLEAAGAFFGPISYLLAGGLLDLFGPQRRWLLFAIVAALALVWAAVVAGLSLRASARELGTGARSG